MNDMTVNTTGKCPVMHGGATNRSATSTKDWWPDGLNVEILHQHGARTNPMDPDFDYQEAVKTLDFEGLKADINALLWFGVTADELEDMGELTSAVGLAAADFVFKDFVQNDYLGLGLADSALLERLPALELNTGVNLRGEYSSEPRMLARQEGSGRTDTGRTNGATSRSTTRRGRRRYRYRPVTSHTGRAQAWDFREWRRA